MSQSPAKVYVHLIFYKKSVCSLQFLEECLGEGPVLGPSNVRIRYSKLLSSNASRQQKSSNKHCGRTHSFFRLELS